MTAAQQIILIDKRLDGIRLEVFRRLGRFNSQSADCWDLAWARCPDLYARQGDLYRQRGAMQKVRDAALEREYRAEQRRKRSALSRVAA